MTEPLVVLTGRHGRDFDLFNQDGSRIGTALRIARTSTYEFRDAADQMVLDLTDAGSAWAVLGLRQWCYEITLPDQPSLISVNRLSRLSDTASITEDSDLELGTVRPPVTSSRADAWLAALRIGPFRPPGTPSRVDAWLAALGIGTAEPRPALVIDDERGRTVGRIHIARVRRSRDRVDLVVEVDDRISPRLRAVALAATVVADRELIFFSGGGA